jgi:hypothetical protein
MGFAIMHTYVDFTYVGVLSTSDSPAQRKCVALAKMSHFTYSGKHDDDRKEDDVEKNDQI